MQDEARPWCRGAERPSSRDISDSIARSSYRTHPKSERSSGVLAWRKDWDRHYWRPRLNPLSISLSCLFALEGGKNLWSDV